MFTFHKYAYCNGPGYMQLNIPNLSSGGYYAPYQYGCQRFLFLLFVIITLIGSPELSWSQNSITVKRIDLPNSFNHCEITHMMLDDEGFLWFVTNQGLWRYDGTDIQPVHISNLAFFQNVVIDDVYRYRNLLFINLLKVGTSEYSIFCYNTETKRLLQFKMPGRPMNYLADKTGALVFMTGNGVKWRFTETDGLRQIERFYTYPGWVKGQGMENTAIDDNGDTYVFSHKKVGLIKKTGIIWSTVTAADKKFTIVNRAYCTPKYIVAGYANGLVVYDKKKLTEVFEQYGGKYHLSLNANDAMLPVYREINDLIVKCTCREPGNSKMLVGTDKGIFEISPSVNKPDETTRQQSIVDFFKNKSVRSIYRAPNNKLYVGTYQGFFVYDGTTFKEINNYIAYTIEPVNKNMLLVGLEGGQGFYILDMRTDKGHLNSNKERALGTTKIIPYGGGYLTGASNLINHLTALPDGDFKVEQLKNDPNLGIVKDLKLINGEIWLASTSGLFKVGQKGKLQKVYPAGRDLGCYSMLIDGQGLWVGTNGEGLIKIDVRGKKIREIHFVDGLAGEYVYSLFKLKNLLIAATSGGVSLFDQLSGMQPLSIPDLPPYEGNLYQEFNHSALFNDLANQKLILGGTQGLTFMDVDFLKSVAGKPNDRIRLSYINNGYNTSQPASIDIFVTGLDTIKIAPGNTFTSLKFSGPFNQKYMLFRIKELSGAWQQRKLADEVSLFAIPPGKYTLQARFPSVTDPRYWLIKTIIVVPRFYQTWFFDIMVGIVLAFIIYMAWIARVREIKNEHLLRTTIASDLHDEIGGALTRISLTSELMNIKQKLDTKVVERISNDSKKAIASISDIIWSIDARNDTKEDLVARMREHVHNMLDSIASVNFEVSGLDKVTNLPQLVRQNIYLVFKEAINNIAKHNKNPEVWIILNNQLMGMIITIQNTVADKKPASTHTGQGLRNMEMRAKRMKATLDILNKDDLFSITIKMKRW